MKKIIITCALFLSFNIIYAQNNQGKTDDAGRIALATVISNDIDGLNPSAQSFLKSKLNRITSNYGMGGSVMSERFIITANVQIISKDITSTAPPMQVYTLEVGFFIGDGIDGKLFASTSKTFKGVGETETKAYRAALKNIKTTDPVFKSFIEEGKYKIIEYYNSQCDFILKEALTMAEAKEYDIAMYKLAEVPKVCKECFEKCQDALVYVFNLKIENECQERIAKSKSFIANDDYESAAIELSMITPDINCYPDVQVILQEIKDHRCAVSLGKAKGAWANRNSIEAAGYLTEIPTDSKCYDEASILSKKISSKLDADEKREWDLAYEKYNRNQNLIENQANHQIELDNRNQDYMENQGFELEMEKVKSATKIAVAYAENQPKNVTYNYKGWW